MTIGEDAECAGGAHSGTPRGDRPLPASECEPTRSSIKRLWGTAAPSLGPPTPGPRCPVSLGWQSVAGSFPLTRTEAGGTRSVCPLGDAGLGGACPCVGDDGRTLGALKQALPA